MFNDPLAHRAFQDFQAKYNFKTIVETGTHMGHGSLHCALYRDRVCTIEANPQFRHQAMLNFQKNGFWPHEALVGDVYEEIGFCRSEAGAPRRIHSFLGNSPEVLNALFASERFARPFLFYLDAHWHDYWPLLDEIRTIAKYGLSDSCIIIHDFQVPGKPFGYDTYQGQPLNLEYVQADLFKVNPNYRTFYNEQACEGNSGRGILYVVPQ